MALIIPLKEKNPQIGDNVFLAENATIIGDVTIGNNSSIWFNVVLRGDVNFISIGEDCNIQDNSTLHGSFTKHSTTLERGVTVGHNAVIHGCHIEENVLIGMGSIIMDGAVVKKNSIVAAGSIVLQGMTVEEGSLYAGSPAKKIKDLSSEAIQSIRQSAKGYIEYASWYKT